MTLARLLPLLAVAAVPILARAQAPASPSPAPAAVAATPVPPDPGTATVPTGPAGLRVGSLLGARIWSSDNRVIGDVEDVLFAPGGNGGEPTVVIAVGGSWGLGGKLVALPLSRLQHSERWVLPGVLPETTGELPAFRFE